MRSFKAFLLSYVLVFSVECAAQDIMFCGEAIPVQQDFVAEKLMNVIKDQIGYVNLSSLKQRANEYFPFIEATLRQYGIPEDFKYVPIVECGFRNLSSVAGARGFWQLMPATAAEYNLEVSSQVDERDDPVKATHAACKLILNNHRYIKNNINASSWVLTAASYNWGVGNIVKTVKRQGTDYFSMSLNPETAEYVYKIIAVKELFENPELYMKDFGRNVFSERSTNNIDNTAVRVNKPVDSEFASLKVRVVNDKKKAPPPTKIEYVPAKLVVELKGKKKDKGFSDGAMVSLQLEKNLNAANSFIRAGNIIKGTGWIIDKRVYIDLGYGHDVQVMDNTATKGIPLEKISDDGLMLILKTNVPRT